MGSSIGLGSCKTVSASLGGYISINKRIYMLTVDHFIEHSIDINAASEMSQNEIASPSLLDVSELTETLEQTIRDLEARFENKLKEYVPSGTTTVENFPCSESLKVLEDDIVRYGEFLQDLSRKTREFLLGQIHRRCVPRLRKATDLYVLGRKSIQMSHRMDWSIFTARYDRVGENRHRHKFCTGGAVDLPSENMNPLGAGILCQETCEVEPNALVHYVGQGSGRQSGQISPAPVLVTCKGVSSWEWAMLLPGDKQQTGEIYYGDSGAWIIRDSDNALVGLLWGWINDNLIFTPIKDVFADIRETLNATEVCLPKPSTPTYPHVVGAGADATQICRVKEQGCRNPLSLPLLPLSNIQLPRAEPISISSLVNSNEELTKDPGSGTLAMDNDKDRTPSPVPSLSSSLSSSPKIVSRFPSALELKSQAGCNLEEPTIAIREDSDSEGNSKADEEPQLFPTLQLKPKRPRGKSVHENRLALGFILGEMGVTKPLFLKSPHEKNMERRPESWVSVETS